MAAKIISLNSVNPDRDALRASAQILENGGVIAYPTETVYGLGANIFIQEAVERIFEIKKRATNKSISAMIASPNEVTSLCRDIPDYVSLLIETFWPGPLTLVLKASEQVPDYMISNENKIGLRLPDHSITKLLMQLHPQPITSTSANVSGEKNAVSADQVSDMLGERIDCVIDGGPCPGQIPSTVIDVSEETPKLLREGAIPFSEIESVVKKGV